ncbi:unnamed protein product [Notodromas monacha]|uniref:Uncharacterized protein n=1 Tax=Notodromas monacha TaxID=399045 RepID=A0A7R9BUN4_9CRUS|nr:unnamed protein product [Notodromas monacha]CAG0922056.1 unnamed protein product [Notodromas monacha]
MVARQSVMERRDIILTAILATLALVVAAVVVIFVYFWCRRNRRLERKTCGGTACQRDAEMGESLHGASSSSAAAPTFSPLVKVDTSHLNGTLNLKTPLISTKSIGNQLGVCRPQGGPNTPGTPGSGMPGSSKTEQHPAMAFWQAKSMSLLDMYVDTSEPTDAVGQIQFSLEYDFSTSTLILKIFQDERPW